MHKMGYWGSPDNRKEFLLDFANKMGFDPMVSDNWRNQRYNLLAHGVHTTDNINFPFLLIN